MAKDVLSQLLTFWKVRDEAGASARNLLFSSSLTPYHTYALPPSPCSAHLALSQSPAQYINGRPDRRSVITLQSLGETFRHNAWDNIFFLINWAKPTMLTDKTPTKNVIHKQKTKLQSPFIWPQKEDRRKETLKSLNYANSNFVPFHHFQLFHSAFKNDSLHNYRKTNSP